MTIHHDHIPIIHIIILIYFNDFDSFSTQRSKHLQKGSHESANFTSPPSGALLEPRLPRRSSSGVLALSCQEGAGEGAGLKPARFLGELVWNPGFVNEGYFKVVGESRSHMISLVMIILDRVSKRRSIH